MDRKYQHMYKQMLQGLMLFSVWNEIHSSAIILVNEGYEKVPTIKADWTSVFLRYNLIEKILANEVAPATQLRSIDLTRNLIEFIHDDAFISCIVLELVMLDHNRLMALPASFGPNPNKLKTLSVERNLILDTPQIYFAKYPGLIDLNVMDTDIDIIDGQGLDTVKFLSMSNKNYMPCFNGHAYLDYLTLKDFNVTKFPPEYLSNMTKLTELYLVGNKFKVFPAITNLPRLSFIYIGGEHVSVIRDLSLLPSLREVSCYSCPLYCGPALCWFVLEDHNIIPYYYYPLTCAAPSGFENSYIDIHSPVDLRCYEGLYCRSYFVGCMTREM